LGFNKAPCTALTYKGNTGVPLLSELGNSTRRG
jgi:hypothetical protein